MEKKLTSEVINKCIEIMVWEDKEDRKELLEREMGGDMFVVAKGVKESFAHGSKVEAVNFDSEAIIHFADKDIANGLKMAEAVMWSIVENYFITIGASTDKNTGDILGFDAAWENHVNWIDAVSEMYKSDTIKTKLKGMIDEIKRKKA